MRASVVCCAFLFIFSVLVAAHHGPCRGGVGSAGDGSCRRRPRLVIVDLCTVFLRLLLLTVRALEVPTPSVGIYVILVLDVGNSLAQHDIGNKASSS